MAVSIVDLSANDTEQEDWKCQKCSQINSYRFRACLKCRAPSPCFAACCPSVSQCYLPWENSGGFSVVAAIDFGTDGTGLAFSVNNSDKEVHIFEEWGSKSFGTKTKTSILLDENDNTIGFGSEALLKYTDICRVNKSGWKLFQNFKMELFQKIPETIQPSSGEKDTDIETVFVSALKCIKEKALDYLQKKGLHINGVKDIQWILTVPAIWSDTAKGLMRQWAQKAGLTDPNISNHLIIAYEPECASMSVLCELYDRKLVDFDKAKEEKKEEEKKEEEKKEEERKEEEKKEEEKKEEEKKEEEKKEEKKEEKQKEEEEEEEENETEIQPGAKGSTDAEPQTQPLLKLGDGYMMLDLGGGTADIVCHEIKGMFEVKELIAPSGGPWGSCHIEKYFELLLTQIFGLQEMNEFQASYPSEYRELMNNFEKSKSKFYCNEQNIRTSRSTSRMHNVALPMEFDTFMSTKYEDLEGLVENFSFQGSSGQCKYVGNLLLSHKVWMRLFDDLIDLIIFHIKTLLATHVNILKDKLKCFFLVGGFSQSKYLQKRIEDAFGNKYKIITPCYPILSVVDGAARLGKIAYFVKSRVIDKTYGVNCAMHILEAQSNPKITPEYIQTNKFSNISSQDEYVNGCFDIFVRKGEEVEVNQMIERKYGRAHDIWWDNTDEHWDTVSIFSTNDPDPATIVGMKPLTTLTLKFPPQLSSKDCILRTRFYFGNTTIRVTTLINTSNNEQVEKEVEIVYDYRLKK